MNDVHDYIRGLAVPAAPVTRAGPAPAPAFNGGQQAVVVGAQMTEFSAQVPQSLRPAISEGLLLGQLAADKAVGNNGDVYLWYQTFGAVMKKIGWLQTDLEFHEQSTSDDNAEVHKAIIPIMTAMLAPGAAAASIILAVLKGMDDMQKNTPWLTLFMQKSQSFQGAKFQLSYVDAGLGSGAALKTVFFGIQAQQAITGVLFFKFTKQTATIRNAQTEMALSATQLEDLAEPLRAKVNPFIAQNIKEIEI